MANNKIKKVTALFDYIRRHNDELSFNKNDIITLTQQIDGGWWEGTLDQVTGWFPSNYVTDIEEEKDGSPQSDVKTSSDIHLLTFQADIVNHILDGEKKHVSKLSHMLTTFLLPSLKISELNESKVQRICDDLQTIIPLHKHIIEALEEMKLTNKNRVGRLYLDMASKISESYYEYASVHLFVIYTLEVNKSSVQLHFETQRLAFDWSLVKQLLSLVFDRLSRYSLLLKEMERYLEDGHPDRGDIQRAIVVYTEINEKCNFIRKKKDRDLDILCANILGWKGERLSQLGDPILTIKVSYIGPAAPIDSQKALNHVVVVMPACLILLACTEQADIYTFKSKLALENLSVFINNEDFNIEMRSELTGEYLHLLCDSKETRNELVTSIKQTSHSQGINGGNKSLNLIDSTSTAVSLSSDTSPVPNISRSIEGKSNEHVSNDGSSINTSDQNVSLRPQEFNMLYKPPNEQLRILRPDPPAAANLISCSQQIPVTRSSSGAGGQFSPKAARRKKEGRLKSAIDPEEVLRVMDSLKETCPKIKDDALVLQVIESYCVSSKGNNSLDLARIRLSDAEIIRSSNNWAYNDHAMKQPRNHAADSVRGRESSGSSNTTASGDNNNQVNRRLEMTTGIMTPCQLNIRGHERGGCACIAQPATSKPIGCAPMISGRNKKKS